MKQTILVIEDEADLLMMIKLTLELAGYRVLGASSAEDGLTLLEQELPSAIILDLNLPGMNGWEFLARLREEGLVPNLPVILATAHASQANRSTAIEAGCREYIEKPFRLEELRQRIAEVVA
ncbi:MAG: response regulator [Actinomycetota bacterium]